MKSLENAESWITSNCWLACFDILGFRNLISAHDDDLKALYVRIDYEETVQHLKKSCNAYESGCIDYCWFSDTFLMFTRDDSPQSYVVIEFAAKRFIEGCVYSGVPIRGAISVGPFMRSKDNRSFIGKAFLEAFEYAEDQDWIGLIITPNGIKQAKSHNLHPTRHDFVQSDKIPMRRFAKEDVVAYRFQNGASNRPSRFLPRLRGMRQSSDKKYRPKYERTEQFIQDHYRWL